MKSESIRSRHKEKQERTRAVFVLIGMLVLISALPLLAQEASSPAQAVPPDVMKQLEALTKRVEQLEQQLKEHEAVEQPTTVVYSAKATAPAQSVVTPAITQGELSIAEPAKNEKIAPFSDWDWTWLNGNPRNKDVAFDAKSSARRSGLILRTTTILTSPSIIRSAGRAKYSAPTKSNWNNSASGAIFTTTMFAPGS